MGYAGGSQDNPTYQSIDDHSETIQIDYDPAQISYEELLDVFWSSHNPSSRPFSRQYASIIFYHNEEQRHLAIETRDSQQAALGGTVFTEIVPFTSFTLAEDYHQKYRLRQTPEVLAAVRALYPGRDEFLNATLTARVNGYVGGYGTLGELEAQVEMLDMSPAVRQGLLEALSEWKR